MLLQALAGAAGFKAFRRSKLKGRKRFNKIAEGFDKEIDYNYFSLFLPNPEVSLGAEIAAADHSFSG